MEWLSGRWRRDTSAFVSFSPKAIKSQQQTPTLEMPAVAAAVAAAAAKTYVVAADADRHHRRRRQPRVLATDDNGKVRNFLPALVQSSPSSPPKIPHSLPSERRAHVLS